mgnify:CR=1 FL=1
MSVSVILPTLNAAGEIAALLAALMDQTQPPEEILVVDSGVHGWHRGNWLARTARGSCPFPRPV